MLFLKTMIKRIVKIIKPKNIQHTELTFDEQKKKEIAITRIIFDLQEAAVSVLTLQEEAKNVALLLLEKAKELQDDLAYKPIYKQELSSLDECIIKSKENQQQIQKKLISISPFYEDLSASAKKYKTFSEQYMYDMENVIYGIYHILRQ